MNDTNELLRILNEIPEKQHNMIDEQFDDFKVAEDTNYVNDSISRIFEKEFSQGHCVS